MPPSKDSKKSPASNGSHTNASKLLASTPLFAQLNQTGLEQLAATAEFINLDSGHCLYEKGDKPEYFYLLSSGRLRVSSDDELLGYVSRLEPVGEIGCIAGHKRESTVTAVRDSHLLRIPRADYLAFLSTHAENLLAVTQLLIARMREQEQQRRAAATETQGIFAILPTSSSVPAMELAAPLTEQLEGWPTARLVSAKHVDATLGTGIAQADYSDDNANIKLRDWLNKLEAHHRYVILVADNPDDNWALRCLRMADRVLVLTEANTPAKPLAAMQKLPGGKSLAPVELVLLRPEGDPSPYTMPWREATGARSHYYVHPWDKDDLAALARQMTGRGIGLVLGGGGARGFAHIGLVRALRELGIPIDVMGGTSMGAFVSALVACGFDSVEMAQIARETFVNNNYLNDYHIPRYSLIRGRRFLVRLREIFGERLVEELPRSFYCVSTNLSTGAAVTHDNGPLANWVGTSMCVPGVAPPVAHEGHLLCDGGVVDNLPTDVMQNLERGSIIACSVSADGDIRATGHGLGLPDPEALINWRSKDPRPRFSEILLRTATLTSDTVIQREAVERADLFIRMPVQRFGMFNWQALDQLIELGYQHALQQLEPQREALLTHDFSKFPTQPQASQSSASSEKNAA